MLQTASRQYTVTTSPHVLKPLKMKQATLKRKVSFSHILRLSLFTMLFLPYTSCHHEARVYKDGDVILGGLFDLHFAADRKHCGELNTMGLGEAEAMIFAIESVNKNPNLLSNVTLGYDIRDACARTALAMQITYDLVRDGDPVCMCNSDINSSAIGKITNVSSKPISVLVGPTTSASAVLVGSLLQVANISAISSSATSVELSSQLYKDFFRTVPPDNWQAKVMADIIELFNWTYVAAVSLDSSYGRNGISALEKESYDRKTFCVAFSEFIPHLGYQEKIKKIVAKIKRQPTIGVIVTWLDSSRGRPFLKVANDENLQGKTFLLSDGLTTSEAVLLDPFFKILDGSLGIQPRDFPHPAFEDHLKEINATKSVKRGVVWWEEFWRSQFNCSVTNSGNSEDALCKANLTSYHALTKIHTSFLPYLFDAVYALAHALDNIYRCSTMHGSTSSCPSVKPRVKGVDLQKYLKSVSFDGLTGKVQFDSSGDPLSASYDIINFQRRSSGARKKFPVGVWDVETTPELQINSSSLRWNSFLSAPESFCASECLPGTMKAPTTPCCWDCIMCPQGTISSDIGSTRCIECEQETKPNEKRTKCEHLPITNITLTTVTGISITVMAFIGFVLTLLVFASYIKLYNTPVVKASNREFSILLLFGIAALFGLAVLELAEISDLFCRTTSFWRYSVLNLCITVLFLKTMRITSVFEVDKVAQLFKSYLKTVRRQTIFISVMNSFIIFLIALWMFIDPPGCQKIIRSNEYIFLVCKPFYTNSGSSLFLAVCTYTLTVALLCTYYAFKARGIPENFNETKYIGFSMYILLLSSLAYYPVAFTFESWYVTLVSCSTTLVTSFGLLSCMFGPKVYILYFRPQHNTLASIKSQVSQYSFNNVPGTSGLPTPISGGIHNDAQEPETPSNITTQF